MNAFERSVIADIDRPVMRERDRARALAARLESICAEAFGLLSDAIAPPTSYEAEAALARRIARFLRENAADAGPERVVL